MKDNEVHITAESTPVPEVEFPETYAAETDFENEAIIPWLKIFLILQQHTSVWTSAAAIGEHVGSLLTSKGV